MDLEALLATADPVTLRTLAEQGVYDEVDRHLDRYPSARDVLAWGALYPRPDRLVEDTARATAILLGGLSAGTPHDRPARDRWAHLPLPTPVLHPAALRSWAPRIGRSEEALSALLAGELFVDRDGRLRVWPWYREQDAVVSPLAVRRAASLGVDVPDRLLDEPHESAWYLARTGQSALLGLARAAGIADPEGARISVLPIPPLAGRVRDTVEGGWQIDRYTLWLERIDALVRRWTYAPDERDATERMLRRAVAAVTGPVAGVRPELALPVEVPEDLSGAPGRELRDLLAVGDGLLLVYDRRAVWLDGERVRRVIPLPEIGSWVVVGWVLLGDRVLPAPAYDLERGMWLGGSLGDVLDAVGAPEAAARDELFESEQGALDATGRFCACSVGIVRVCDAEWLAPTHQMPCDDEDHEHERALPVVGAQSSDPESRIFEIDGVRFTSRPARRHGVPPARPSTFGLGPDGWRFVCGNLLYAGLPALPVARLGFEARRAAFTADARTLWAADATALHRMRWSDGHTDTWNLEPLAEPHEGLVLARLGGAS